jgi:hypothetical protein
LLHCGETAVHGVLLLTALNLSCVQYGKVLSIDMKAPVRPPAFAFVEYG